MCRSFILCNRIETELLKDHTMGEYNEESILEELEIFRWSLYNAKKEDVKEKEQSLLDEACQKSIYEPFIEEYLIAGCDTNVVISYWSLDTLNIYIIHTNFFVH